MGGTKCIFRSCKKSHNNSNDLHFFHFPTKKKKLLEQWIKMSKTSWILDMPESQQRNKSICMLHFRDECFMNYVKNRLVPDAVPTLDRLPNGMVLDYEKGENPNPTTLSPPKQPHLIPPQGYKTCTYATVSEKDITINTTALKRPLISDENGDEVKKIRPNKKSTDSPKILNKLNRLPSKTVTITADDEIQDIVELQEIDNERDDNFVELVSASPKNSIEIIQVENLPEDKTNLSDAYTMIVQLEEELSEVKKKAEDAERRAEKAEKFAKQLKEEQAKLQQQVSTVSTSKEQLFNPSPLPTQLTKAQLFNAVKKYLNSSMTALLRMEMFGNGEREWKPDEREIAMDILRLGKNVYDFFNDEWRFRLPSKILVEQWLREAPNALFDNECDL